ncbi:MAG: hypothetical protein IPM68_08285, partial [Flavobacteriales bacterium]|nr:hypothetical protein [Flavobacteriales bacterium]
WCPWPPSPTHRACWTATTPLANPPYRAMWRPCKKRFAGRSVGVISFQREYLAHRCEVLSESGDLAEAARHLFAVLRELDGSDCAVIVAEEFPEEGLGRAINDRLRRAAGGR